MRSRAASIRSRSSDAVVLVGLDVATPGIDCDHALHSQPFCRQLSDRTASLNRQGNATTRFCDAAGLAGSPCSDELSAISRSTDDSRSIEAAGEPPFDCLEFRQRQLKSLGYSSIFPVFPTAFPTRRPRLRRTAANGLSVPMGRHRRAARPFRYPDDRKTLCAPVAELCGRHDPGRTAGLWGTSRRPM
jgi:hypothetical protein